MNRTPDEIIAAIEMCATSGVGNLLIGDNEMARLVLAWREATARIERLEAALREIVSHAGPQDDEAAHWCSDRAYEALNPSRPSQPEQEKPPAG